MAGFTHFGQEIYTIKSKSCGMNAESDLSLEKKDIASCYVLSILSQFRNFKNRPDWDGRKNLNHSFLQFSLSAKKFNLKLRSILQNESLEIPEVWSMSRRSIRRNYGGLWTQYTPNELTYLCTSPRWVLTQKMAKFTHFGQEIYRIKTKSCGMNAESDLSLEKKT